MFKHQILPGPCGVYAIQGALRMLGHDVPVLSMVSMWDLTVSIKTGFGEKELCDIIRNRGFKAKERRSTNKTKFLSRLRYALRLGNPCIMAMQDSRHWATLIGYHDNYFMWYDSYDSQLIGMWTEDDIIDWFDSDDYYFIEVINQGTSLVNHIPIDCFLNPTKRRQLLNEEITFLPTPVNSHRK